MRHPHFAVGVGLPSTFFTECQSGRYFDILDASSQQTADTTQWVDIIDCCDWLQVPA